MKFIYMPIETDEHDALMKFARHEKRDPRFQAALILRGELERRGYLPGDRREVRDEERAT